MSNEKQLLEKVAEHASDYFFALANPEFVKLGGPSVDEVRGFLKAALIRYENYVSDSAPCNEQAN